MSTTHTALCIYIPFFERYDVVFMHKLSGWAKEEVHGTKPRNIVETDENVTNVSNKQAASNNCKHTSSIPANVFKMCEHRLRGHVKLLG